MQSVAVDDANPQTGEEAYILQVSIPSAPGVDGGDLMDKIGRFVELYLSAAQPEDARFAQMGGTTWVIAASAEAAFTLDQARADLAATLFGSDDGTAVQLEWPDGVEPIDPNAVENTPEEADAVDPADEAAPGGYAPPAEEVPIFAPEPEDAFELAPETGFETGDDAWTLGDGPSQPVDADTLDAPIFVGDDIDFDLDEVPAGGEVETEAQASPQAEGDAGDGAVERSDEAGTAFSDTTSSGDDDVFVIDDLNEGRVDEAEDWIDETALAPEVPDTAEAAYETEADTAYTLEVASAAQRAAFDDTTDVFEVDAYDIEIVDPETGALAEDFSVEPEAATEVFDIDEPEALETLTEVPDRPQAPDIAKELSAFRAEMREIASSIPGGSAGDLLADFRAELDAISGAMGQRVDGAAQRIEAAASQVVEASARLDAERLNAAAERAEESARQLEAGVAEALSALNAARNAMSGDSRSVTTDAIG